MAPNAFRPPSIQPPPPYTHQNCKDTTPTPYTHQHCKYTTPHPPICPPVCMYFCIYVYVRTYVCICIYIHAHTCICPCSPPPMCIYAYMYMQIRTYVRTYTYIQKYIYAHRWGRTRHSAPQRLRTSRAVPDTRWPFPMTALPLPGASTVLGRYFAVVCVGV